MSIFIDTSAFLAILDADDINHKKADKAWKTLVINEEVLVCTNYVLVETFALLQNRLGIEAVKIFQEDVFPMLIVEWVDETGHRAGVNALLATNRKKLSLVDCISFDNMRRLGIKSAFVFDKHFKEQGFNCVP